MVLLSASGMLSVSIGTVAWATVSFLIVLFLLKKYAWGPIVKSLQEREHSIENALNEAQKARNEMANLKAGNEALLREARDERDRILKEAKVVAEKMRTDIELKAKDQSERMLTSAKLEIDNQKKAAMTELKNYVGTLSIDIAEKLVRDRLTDSEKQQALNSKLISEIRAN
jgi:F-type H+-transporting ATPase subunit b